MENYENILIQEEKKIPKSNYYIDFMHRLEKLEWEAGQRLEKGKADTSIKPYAEVVNFCVKQ